MAFLASWHGLAYTWLREVLEWVGVTGLFVFQNIFLFYPFFSLLFLLLWLYIMHCTIHTFCSFSTCLYIYVKGLGHPSKLNKVITQGLQAKIVFLQETHSQCL